MPVRRLVAVRRPWILVNAVLGVAIAGGAVWTYVTFVQPESSSAASNEASLPVPVRRGPVTATVSAAGTVRSASTANAAFTTAGTVTAIQVKVGDVVAKGAVLAKVDATASNRQLTAAQANLDAANAALDRARDAGGDTADAQSQVTSAELAVEQAQDAVDGTVLKAPMGGTVVAVNGSLGGSSNAGAGSNAGGGSSGGGANSGAGPNGGNGSGGASGAASGGGSTGGSSGGFIELADLKKLEVSASVAETDATKLKTGQAATVTWNALPDATATGKLASIDPNATSSNNVVTYGVTVSLDSLPDGIRAGQTVNVAVTVGQVDDAVFVNPAALTTIGNRHTVTVLENGQQTVRPVEVGLTGDQAVEIKSGLQEGEQVILRIGAAGGTGTNGRPGFPGGGGVLQRGGGGFPGGGGLGGRGGFGGARTGGGR